MTEFMIKLTTATTLLLVINLSCRPNNGTSGPTHQVTDDLQSSVHALDESLPSSLTRHKIFQEIVTKHMSHAKNAGALAAIFAKIKNIEVMEINPNLALSLAEDEQGNNGFSFKLEIQDQLAVVRLKFLDETDSFNLWIAFPPPDALLGEKDLKAIMTGQCPDAIREIALRGVDVQKYAP